MTGRQAEPLARNVILFLADAGGIPTLSAASLHGYGEGRRLFVQRMPHIGLADTATASQFVTDSAAGMTAIVTGHRTHNGVVGQGPDAVRGVRDGTPLTTILEMAGGAWSGHRGHLERRPDGGDAGLAVRKGQRPEQDRGHLPPGAGGSCG